jgi:1-deoxy-D-xylulose-5-phosphate synthase
MDEAMLATLVRDHRVLLTVEDGPAVNGFGAAVAARVADLAPDTRVIVMGAPDQTWEHAPRPSQLAAAGLTAEAIADRVRAVAAHEARVGS